MSRKNGDKARFRKEQKKKLLRRRRTLAVRQALTSNTVIQTPASTPAAPAAPLITAEPEAKGMTDAIL